MQRVRLSQDQLQQELRLIEAAKGDRRRFAPLYERYHRQIFLFVFKRTGEEDVAGDIVAQVFLKAMNHLDRYTYRGVPFSAWLYRIASNEVNQFFRNKKGDRVVSMQREQIERVVGMLDESDEEENTEYYVRVMLETLKEMKPEEIEIIELRFFEQRPFKEVAFIMGITENNAKVKVYRILERLRKRLQKKIGGSYYEA